MNQKVLAALQIGSHPAGTAETVDRLMEFESQIRDCECQLLVMPEALLGGYPKGSDFGTRVGYRTDAGRDAYLKYWQEAVDLDGPHVMAICKLAKRCRTSVVVGVIERGGSTLFCTALFISDQGMIVGKHRKLMPTASERLIWGQGDGETLPVFETAAGRAGVAICWENYMPLLRTALYTQKIGIWCAPTVDDREIWQASMRHIAYEGRNFVVSACQYQAASCNAERQGQQDADYWPEGKPLIRGGSVILSPMGEVLAGPVYDQEGVIAATVDSDDLVRARYDLDVVGHYSRPDIFKLRVNDQPAVATGMTAEQADGPLSEPGSDAS